MNDLSLFLLPSSRVVVCIVVVVVGMVFVVVVGVVVVVVVDAAKEMGVVAKKIKFVISFLGMISNIFIL